MKKSSNKEIRDQVIGLGQNSIRKGYYRELMQKQKDLETQNKLLEEEIIKRNDAEVALHELNEALESKIVERTAELEKSLGDLERTQKYLIESEKLASLGTLVNGISHEINTPLGTCVTTSTFLQKQINDLRRNIEDNKLSKPMLLTQLNKLSEGQQLITDSVIKSADMVNNFKQIASDQYTHKLAEFCVYEYINLVLNSTNIHSEKTVQVETKVNCSESLVIKGYPGLLSRLIVSFVSNSMMHGFKNRSKGLIEIDFSTTDAGVEFRYRDDGCGINKAVINKIFDPFFTTSRSGDTSGLGLYTAYNIVIGNLGGTIKCESEEGHGVELIIQIPKITGLQNHQEIVMP